MKSPDLPSVSRTEAASPSQHAKGIKRIFVGPQGIRVGWRIALFWLIFAAIFAAAGFMLRGLFHVNVSRMKTIPPSFLLVAEAVQLTAIAAATTTVALIERRSPFSYGLQGSARAVRFAGGFISGVAGISVLVGVLWSLGYVQLQAGGIPTAEAVRYGLLWAIVFLAVGFFEEMMLRGYFLYALTRRIGFWWATLLTSVIFGAIHGVNHGETVIGLLQAGAFGLIACLSIWYTGSLWWAIGCHFGWDWAQSFVYGVHNSGLQIEGALLSAQPAGNVWLSGGNTGPEGSVFALLMCAAMAALMFLWWRRGGSAFARAGVN
ncbi:CPBP family intramembrane glutamic endopeptidase [Paraburkholderia sp. J12]|uniref:CPBP family intramembrane glutamic endopeptidase n=1 Tax=Paraburkholderia sp. J12 TaxID=2805432 RepID=UPI002ABE4F61|nr:CPBP family intramembrane glutamic endopeptidase [Paraburkholderia sp. J12]